MILAAVNVFDLRAAPRYWHAAGPRNNDAIAIDASEAARLGQDARARPGNWPGETRALIECCIVFAYICDDIFFIQTLCQPRADEPILPAEAGG